MMNTKVMFSFFLTSFFLLFLITGHSTAAEQLPGKQTLYVPAYSHIYHGNKETPLLLSVTLSIRNIDPHTAITITKVDYHETDGPLIKAYLKSPLTLGPLGSKKYIVPQRDNTGGSGANFIVSWEAEKPVNPPIVETVMIGTQSQLGISFTSRGVEIH